MSSTQTNTPTALDKFIAATDSLHDFAASIDSEIQQTLKQIDSMRITIPATSRASVEPEGHTLESALFTAGILRCIRTCNNALPRSYRAGECIAVCLL